VEKRSLKISAVEKSGSFEPHRERDVLTEALGNPEHRGRVCGVSLRQSWKEVEAWQSDAISFHTRQRYKEGLIQKGKNETVKEMIMGKIQDAFTSTDPKMVEPRTQMFHQTGVLPRSSNNDCNICLSYILCFICVFICKIQIQN
jgi:hypothetical protein